MFSKTKEPESAPAPQQPLAVPQPKGRARPGVPSIISADLTVRGTLISAGDVQIDGRLEGDVRAGALVVGEKASIEGEIAAEEVIIRGKVQGGIRARKIQLCATSHVEGNILHEALSMEAGAFFEGNCRHSDNPIGDEQSAPAHVNFAKAPASAKTNGSHGIASEPAAPAAIHASGASYAPLKS